MPVSTDFATAPNAHDSSRFITAMLPVYIYSDKRLQQEGHPACDDLKYGFDEHVLVVSYIMFILFSAIVFHASTRSGVRLKSQIPIRLYCLGVDFAARTIPMQLVLPEDILLMI
jgi:hypothetical protein